jgi:hypothetical protein
MCDLAFELALLVRSRVTVSAVEGRPIWEIYAVRLRSRSISIGPDIRQDYPLNLSILISGGKETNKDSPSNGE